MNQLNTWRVDEFLVRIGNYLQHIFVIALTVLGLAACKTSYNPLDDFEPLEPSTQLRAPDPRVLVDGAYDPAQVAKGKYLVELLGCGSCHTDRALIGRPNPNRLLAGSSVGIAYSNPLQQKYPGVVYPANLTPDPDTGIGSWSEQELVQMIRTGVDKHGRHQLSVMPWPAYSTIREEDALAIAAYLLNIPAIEHRVPQNVPPGNEAIAPYVHFGVYFSR